MFIARRDLLALACAAISTFAVAQDNYPNRPIKVIVPYPPGASTDILGRAVAQKLSTSMGVPVIVENKPGASGTMGSDFLAKSPPDGYTIGIAVPSTHSLPVALGRKVPYDPIKDFTPLSILANNLPVAKGTVVVNGNRIAVEVGELLGRPLDMR